MITDAIKSVVENKNLSRENAISTMQDIMGGTSTPSQIASLLTALRMKGETVDEITGFAQAMRSFSSQIKPQSKNLVDTCGTGGDVSYTFNISTISAIVAAGAGVVIAKHGNRSVSSKCGSADLLEALGGLHKQNRNRIYFCPCFSSRDEICYAVKKRDWDQNDI